MALCAFSLCSIATYAQQDRNVVFHMSDKTTKTVSLAGVDSLTSRRLCALRSISTSISIPLTSR